MNEERARLAVRRASNSDFPEQLPPSAVYRAFDVAKANGVDRGEFARWLLGFNLSSETRLGVLEVASLEEKTKAVLLKFVTRRGYDADGILEQCGSLQYVAEQDVFDAMFMDFGLKQGYRKASQRYINLADWFCDQLDVTNYTDLIEVIAALCKEVYE